MSRQQISLNGTWQFAPQLETAAGNAAAAVALDRSGFAQTGYTAGTGRVVIGETELGRVLPNDLSWRPSVVPGCCQAQFEDLRHFQGVSWYRRVFNVPADWQGRAVRLRFGAVDYYCEVWLNGRFVGSHEGGYTPFAFEVSEFLVYGAKRDGQDEGENVLIVRVIDPTDDASHYPEFPLGEIPHGKQSWYGPISGIWQDVTLEATAWTRIEGIRVTPKVELASATVEIDVRSVGEPSADACSADRTADLNGGRAPSPSMSLDIEVQAPSGRVFRSSLPMRIVIAGNYKTDISFVNPELWTLADPQLYTIVVRLLDGDGQVLDVASDRFGMRQFQAKNGRFYLNGEPVYLKGLLDQDYYADGIVCPAAGQGERVWRDQFQKAKAMGFNLLRCHMKVPDPRYLELADEMGLLVWVELPNVSRLTDASKGRIRSTLEAMLQRDWNHPSLVIRSIINENWGTDLVNDPSHRQWLQKMVRWLRQADPSRLVVDNSACPPNFHVETDIEDFHFYCSIPDHVQQWDERVREFAGRAAWTYSPYGDSVRRGNEPLVVSEFGNWGLPDVRRLRAGYGGQDPWWFESGADWAKGAVQPKNVQVRVAEYGLEQVFGSYEELVRQSQWNEFLSLKYEIESIRLQPSIAGYVITELTDVHWESNGLLDMWRNPKVFHGLLPLINADTVIVPRPDRYNAWSGEDVHVAVWLAFASREAAAQARNRGLQLEWYLEGAGVTSPPAFLAVAGGGDPPGAGVIQAGNLTFPAPSVASPAKYRLLLRLLDRAGEVLAENFLDLQSFARETAQDQAAGASQAGASQRSVWVVPRMDEPVLEHLRRGGTALVVAEDEEAVPGDWGRRLGWPRLVRRQGTVRAGDWANNLNWIRVEGNLEDLRGVGPQVPGQLGKPEVPAGSEESVPAAEAAVPGFAMDFAFQPVISDLVIDGVRSAQFSDVLSGMFVGWVHQPAAYAYQFRLGAGRAILTTLRLQATDPMARTLLQGWTAYLASGRCQPSTVLPDPGA
ncbi:MAG: hypothetical protein IMW99_08635 [Firmicutes bacterium]|nr:hypothetical protein [Bacillota bacterium]